jgi:hypothetical protein
MQRSGSASPARSSGGKLGPRQPLKQQSGSGVRTVWTLPAPNTQDAKLLHKRLKKKFRVKGRTRVYPGTVKLVGTTEGGQCMARVLFDDGDEEDMPVANAWALVDDPFVQAEKSANAEAKLEVFADFAVALGDAAGLAAPTVAPRLLPCLVASARAQLPATAAPVAPGCGLTPARTGGVHQPKQAALVAHAPTSAHAALPLAGAEERRAALARALHEWLRMPSDVRAARFQAQDTSGKMTAWTRRSNIMIHRFIVREPMIMDLLMRKIASVAHVTPERAEEHVIRAFAAMECMP